MAIAQDSIDQDSGDGGGGSGGAYVPPAYQSGDWARIAQLVAGHTDYRSVNFAVTEGTGVALDGTYTILSVSGDEIVLSNPTLVNPTWDNINVATQYASPALSTSGERWIGWFEVPGTPDRLLFNIVALNGLYEDDGKSQRAYPVSVEAQVQPTDADGNPIGDIESFPATVPGNSNDKNTRATSFWVDPTFSGSMRARMRRTTDADLTFKGTVVDEVKWRDLYSAEDVAQKEFGNVTTVMSRTFATNSALSVKDRRLNMRVRRRLPQRIEGATFGASAATVSADDIISDICLDPTIGGMQPGQVDFDEIYETIETVRAYFGSVRAGDFGYTFDDSNTSAQEMLAVVADAVFCRAYRQGTAIRIAFEGAGEDATLIFNARNTIPRSQKRSILFGLLEDNDGVDLDYLSHVDGAQLTVKAPVDGSAASPANLKVPGVQWPEQASWHLWRAWNRARYQSFALEFEGTDEASILIETDRILVADLTRSTPAPGGEIEDLDGQTARLSAPVDIADDGTWTIFIQHVDGTVEALGARPVADDPYAVTLSAPPRAELSLDPENVSRAKYELARDTDHRIRRFLVLKRDRQEKTTHRVQAINYSFLYYMQDETVLWLSFDGSAYLDDGPYRLDPVVVGPPLSPDPTTYRGNVYRSHEPGHVVTFPPFTPPTSYTIAAWLRRDDRTASGSILGSDAQTFGFAGAQLQAGNPAQAVAAAWPDDALWHYAVVTFDEDAEEMVLLIDGVEVDVAETVPAAAASQLVAFRDYVGDADDLRMWRRTLTLAEINEVYRSTLNGSNTSGALVTDDNRKITTEDGRILTWE